MNHSNQYIVGLALCTFANIASEEMSRDLANELEKLVSSSNVYIRKKVHRRQSERADRAGLIVCDAHHPQGARPARPLRDAGDEPAVRSKSRRAPLRRDVGDGHVRGGSGGGGRLSQGGAVARAASQGARHDRLFARARRVRHHRPVPAGQDPAAAADPRDGRCRGVGDDERHPRPGRDEHGCGQERRQLDPLRGRPDHPRH